MRTTARRFAPKVGTWILIGLLLLAPGAGAQQGSEGGILASPGPVISYQGTLTDQNGNPVNTTVSMEFAMYDAASGGNPLWGPEPQPVDVSTGHFHVLLGSITPISPTALPDELWLEITVDGEVLSPREQMASVLFATNAASDFSLNDHNLLSVNDIFAGDPDAGGWSAKNFQLTNDLGNIRLRATNSLYLFIDTDDNSEDAAFQLLKDSNGFNPGYAEVFKVLESGLIAAHGDLDMNDQDIIDAGKGFFAGGASIEGAINLQSIAVPATFKESDQSGAGSLWRMPLDGKVLRFDASQNGTDFSSYKTPLTMYPNGTVGCGAITENNLQTAEERQAGGSDRFEEGDVLCWGVDQLEKCASPHDPLVQAVADEGGRPIVMGAEAIKVLGPVQRGDYLVASSVPGYAMVASDPAFGTVIAQALEDFDGEQGLIKAMIRKL